VLKNFLSSSWFHPLLLLLWIVIGAGLRFCYLTGKSPWTDEFATLVFSLGNGYQNVPLDQAISLETLLKPLEINPTAGAKQVIDHLITEDHHPPLYFVLAHYWMNFLTNSVKYVSLYSARSLPALLGVISIPAIFGLGLLAFRSRLVAQLAAAMMAVSPYGIFLAQEARHYTLSILWVIASLSCLIVAMQNLQRRTPLPIWVGICWVIINSLGIATHYFFSLTLIAQALVLLGFWLLGSPLATILVKYLPIPNLNFSILHTHWLRIYAVAVGTCVGCLVWIPVWKASHNSQMTQWIMTGERNILSFINPIFQSLAAWITMLSLLPVEAPSLPIVIVSGLVMLIFFIWGTPIIYRACQIMLGKTETRLGIGVLGGFVLGSIAIFFSLAYFFGIDLTRGARYNFVYFPAVPVLLGATLAITWKTSFASQLKINGKSAVAIILLMGFLSGITVVNNLGYQKYYRPDLFVPEMQRMSRVPTLIATTHNTLVQTGEMMGIAWEIKRKVKSQNKQALPQFLLAHQEQNKCQETACQASITLQKTLDKLPRPLDLWLVNFQATINQETPNCLPENLSKYQTSVNGYSSRLYHCLATDSETSRTPKLRPSKPTRPSA
jgi:uncharacterized membrane protein